MEKALTESDVTGLDFDDDNLRGENKNSIQESEKKAFQVFSPVSRKSR